MLPAIAPYHHWIEQLSGVFSCQEPLARDTSWRVGGYADYVYRPDTIADCCLFLQRLPLDIPLTWLGLGSNVLVRDGGIRGVVIITQGGLKELEQITPQGIRAQAGVACGQLARFAARHALQGLEFLAGIPGTIGGALAMNAGCYGNEIWRWVQSVECIHRDGHLSVQEASAFKIAYRSVQYPINQWFAAATFQLQPGDRATSLANIRALLDQRNASQPTSLASCGSVFCNPPNGEYAARLIENCGLKGYRIGGAEVSNKHANFIINHKDASAADIEQLIYFVQQQVFQKTSVLLQPEVRILGEAQ